MVSEAVAGQALNPHGSGVKPGCLAISLHDETGCNSHMALCSSLPLAHQSPSPQQRTRPTRSIKAVNYRILGLWRLMCLKEICLHVFDRRCLREMLRTGTFSSSTAWRAVGWSTTSDPNKWPPENTERCVAMHVCSRNTMEVYPLPVAAGIKICLLDGTFASQYATHQLMPRATGTFCPHALKYSCTHVFHQGYLVSTFCIKIIKGQWK